MSNPTPIKFWFRSSDHKHPNKVIGILPTGTLFSITTFEKLPSDSIFFLDDIPYILTNTSIKTSNYEIPVTNLL